MNCLTIGGGPSVNNYKRKDLAALAKKCYTLAVNYACFEFECEIVVACDYQWIIDNKRNLLKLGKPIITRKWPVLKGIGLDLIEMPNDCVLKYRLSGMLAAKLGDALGGCINKTSYVIGLDNTPGHFYDKTSDCSKIVTLGDYAAMGLCNTVNLGGKASLINCWPKEDFLPDIKNASESDRYYAQLALAQLGRELLAGYKKDFI